MQSYPLEYALVAFEGNKFSGTVVPGLLDLADRGIVRFVDIVFIQKDKDGSLRLFELNDLDEESYKMFVPLGEPVASLFSQEDLDLAASKLPKNTSAALFFGRTCGRRISAKRSPIRGVCWSSAGRFPPKSSSRSSGTSPQKDKRTRRRTNNRTEWTSRKTNRGSNYVTTYDEKDARAEPDRCGSHNRRGCGHGRCGQWPSTAKSGAEPSRRPATS